MPKGHKKARNVFKWYRTVSMLGTPPPPHFFYNPRLPLCKAHPTKRWALGSRSEPQGLESGFRGGSETHGNPARGLPAMGGSVACRPVTLPLSQAESAIRWRSFGEKYYFKRRVCFAQTVFMGKAMTPGNCRSLLQTRPPPILRRLLCLSE